MRSDVDLEAHPGFALHLLEGHDADDVRPYTATAAEFERPATRSAIVRIVRSFRASSDRVFAAWLDATSAGRWLFATASRPMTAAEIDPRVGGRFRFVERSGTAEYAGRYVEIVASRRLAFTLAIKDGGEAMVTIDIIPRRNGCRLVLREQPVAPRERERIEGRWTGILYGLGLFLDASDASSHPRS